MNIGVTIARVRKTGKLRVILGPEVPVADQIKALKTDAFKADVAKDHDLVHFFTSNGERSKRVKLKGPDAPRVVVPEAAKVPAPKAPEAPKADASEVLG